MRLGITAYATYVPRYRLRREIVGTAWGIQAPPGCKAVRAFDEDALTMGQAAAWKIVKAGTEPALLAFASTSAPYWQRSSASLIAAACDLGPAAASADFGATLRAGTTALRLALEAGRPALVVASEAREGAPESTQEMLFGDAAAAVAVGTEGVIAELVSAASRADDFPDEWRRDGDPYVHSFASRFTTSRGYAANCVAAAREAIAGAGAIAHAAIASPDGRAQAEVARALAIPPDRVVDTRAGDLGVTGAAMPLLLLAQALDRAQPGDLMLAVGYGDGADALLFRATDRLAELPRPLLRDGGAALEYSSYALYRKLRGWLRETGGGPEISNVLLRREEPQNLRLRGAACPRCGSVQYPAGRLCAACRHPEGLVERRLGRTGTLFTFTRDFLYDAPVQPTVEAVVDLDGGGRFLCQMTDVDPAAVEIGMPVELTLRRMREGPSDHHYYWKCRPAARS